MTLDRSVLSWPCQVWGAAQRPGFYCLCTWLTCFIGSMGTDQDRGGVDFSREESGASHSENTRDHLAGVGAGSSHRAQCC